MDDSPTARHTTTKGSKVVTPQSQANESSSSRVEWHSLTSAQWMMAMGIWLWARWRRRESKKKNYAKTDKNL